MGCRTMGEGNTKARQPAGLFRWSSMPLAAPRPCIYPGCHALTPASLCDEHRKLRQRQQDQQRGSSAKRFYGYRWQQASKGFLQKHPTCECEDCRANGWVTPAEVVDHRIPHRGDFARFWDRSNWQAMAKACHDKKTAREDGGFGNRRGLA